MLTLRLAHTKKRTGPAIDLWLEDGDLVEAAVSGFEFAISDEDAEDIRWYLEDYLMYPVDPAPEIARHVEDRIREIGSDLYSAVFSSLESRYLWSVVRPRLGETRIEIVDEQGSAAIPWELMRDPTSGETLSLRASAFVRTSAEPKLDTRQSTPGRDRVRILLVICRPRGRNDVGFRATAKHIINQLHDLTTSVEIDVLRPPTFSRLKYVLWSAREDGRPYDIVHFDGHGAWMDLAEQTGLPVKAGFRGYVLFEGSEPDHPTYVDGTTMGDLLRQCEVPVLLLNACRSAHRDPFGDDGESGQSEADLSGVAPARAYGSFAQEVCGTGLAGVVAMRYNIYVVTAAQFVAYLYKALLAGESLGEAVVTGRRQLADYPMREITSQPRSLQDWLVPVVYESRPLNIFAHTAQGTEFAYPDAQNGVLNKDEGEPMSLALADQPRFGFYGRDDTLFDLDRAFTSYDAVLLHGYAGEGKTASAIEFARWYAKTGGMPGPLIYTSFGSRQTTKSLIDEIGKAFDQVLEERSINWLGRDEPARWELARDLLLEFSALWIWDNFELSTHTDTAASLDAESGLRSEVADFLAKMKSTGAKILITSTRPELWLDGLVHRVQIDPMPMMERLQLARAVAKHHGADISAIDDWVGLLQYTQGNPLTIILAVAQAVRTGFAAKADLDSFVSRLQAGETAISEDASITSSRIGITISKVLEEGSDSADLAVLSALAIFRHFVTQAQLMTMNPVMAKNYPGNEPPPYSLVSVVKDASNPLHPMVNLRPEIIGPLIDRCLDLGLLTLWKIDGQAIEAGYHIHPAFASYLWQTFKKIFGSVEGETGRKIAYCFAGSYAQLGSLSQYMMSQESETKSIFMTEFSAQEFNFLHALRLAVTNELWSFVPYIADGLGLLYKETGRMADWTRVVSEISPLILDEDTYQPVRGDEDLWSKFVNYEIQVAALSRDWDKGERLSRLLVAKFRNDRSTGDTHDPHALADSLMSLGEILSTKGDHEGATSAHREAVRIYQEAGDRKAEATGWLILGDTWYRQDTPDSLDEAERCYERSLELGDHQNEVACTGQLAGVAYSRFIVGSEYAVSGSASDTERDLWVDQCLKAAELYERYLDMLPDEDVRHRAYAHSRLGQIYGRMGEDVPFVMEHFNRAIELYEFENNRYQAGHTRREASMILVVRNRHREAMLYSQAALADFQSYGTRAREEDIEVIHRMISGIERLTRQAEQE